MQLVRPLRVVLRNLGGSGRRALLLPPIVAQQHQHRQALPPPSCQAPQQESSSSGGGEQQAHTCSMAEEAGREPAAAAAPHQNGNGHHHHHTNGNGNGVSGSSNGARHVFAGTTAAQLQEWMEKHGVDTSGYGTGLAKTVQDLLEEQSRAESVLSVEGGVAMRTVRVLSLHILNDAGEVLYEEEQILPDGRSRKRQVAVSEKLVGDECWRAAVDRAIHEELSMALPTGYQVEVLENTYRRFEELSTSMSYPGLLTKYVFHRVNARLPGLPSGPFETREPRPGGHLTTRWAWKDARLWEQECTATCSQG